MPCAVPAIGMQPETVTRLESAIESFADGLRGDLILPEDPGYEETRTVWNGLVNEYPAMIVRCAGGADVATAVEFASEHELSLSVHSAGHHETGSAVSGELVVDVSAMDSVQVDPANRTVRVEPGARSGDVHHETQRFGLAAPTGSADSIGIGGSTLGGGIGWIRRAHGMGVDALRSVEVVTADGQLRHASPEHNADLFWGLRGAGGNFGVVTAFEFDLYPVGPEVLSLGVFYPAEHTREVLETHREFVRDAPPELTTIVVCGHVPDLPMIPEHARGRDGVGILGCYAGDLATGRSVVEPLREVADPIVDLTEPMPYLALHELGSALYPDGRNYCWRSSFVEELTDDLVEAIEATADRAPSPTCGVSVWSMGGAVRDVGPDETAFRWRDDQFMLVAEANWEGTDSQAHVQWARETDGQFRELGARGAYSGFPGLGDTEEDVARIVYGDNYDRLAELKAEYDPTNLFDATTVVPPAE